MTLKKAVLWLISCLLLASCSLGPFSPGSSGTPTATLPPGVIPTDTPTPTLTPTPTPSPEVRLATADEALFNGDYGIAQSEYQAALDGSADPQVRANALWGLALSDYRAGINGKALQDILSLAGAYPDSSHTVSANFILGEIYMALGRYAEAAQAYAAYAAARPGVIDFYVQARLGDAHFTTGSYPAAITAYQLALAAPHIGDDTAIEISIAQAYNLAGDPNTALSMYDSIAAASSNDYVKAQMDLLSGQILIAQGLTDQGYQHYLNAVNNYPLAYDSYTGLVVLVNAGIPVNDLDRGLVDYFAGQYGYALDAFHRSIASNPQNDGTADYYIALTLRAMGQYQQAVDQFTSFTSNFPDNHYWSTAWDEKAYTQWAYLDQYDQAVQTWRDFIGQTADTALIPQAMHDIGRTLERSGQLEAAAAAWEDLANTYPGSELAPEALFQAGIARYRSGAYDQALVTFQRDALLSTVVEDQVRAYFWIAKTQQTLGDNAAAQAGFQQAAGMDPTDYYSLRAQDILFQRPVFEPPPAYDLAVDTNAERSQAEAWLRVTFGLPADTDLGGPGDLATDARLIRGTELWNLGLYDEARLEFEELREAVQLDPARTYRLTNYLLDLGLYRPAIFAARQVLSLAGMNTQLQTLAAPRYFNHIRYGSYYRSMVLSAAAETGLNPLFLYGVIRQESLFEGFVRSTAGARGLMQIVPSTGQSIAEAYGWPADYTDDDLYRPAVSLRLGAFYLKNNVNLFNGEVYPALAAYNAGPGNAQVWRDFSGGDPDLFLEVVRFAETRNYIKGIYEIYWMYRSLYERTP